MAFDDRVNQDRHIGVLNRPAMRETGLPRSVMVETAVETAGVAVAAGSAIVQPIGVDAAAIAVRLRDPAGNVSGMYQPR